MLANKVKRKAKILGLSREHCGLSAKSALVALLLFAFIIPNTILMATSTETILNTSEAENSQNTNIINRSENNSASQTENLNTVATKTVTTRQAETSNNTTAKDNTAASQNLENDKNENSKSITERFALYYYQDGIELDPDYLDNKEQMEHINNYLAESHQIDSIVVYAYASPEGVYEHNVWLSKRRAEAAKKYILNQNPDIDEATIILRPMAENWDGLYEEVKANYHRYDRDFILKTIKDDSIGNDTKKWRIGRSNDGISWRYLIIHNMPRLRVATWICVWEKPLIEQVAELAPVEIAIEDVLKDIFVEDEPIELSETIINPRPLKERVTILALKTNLLYDLVTALNAEVEIPFGKNFSLMLEDVFPWWTWGPNEKKFAFQMWEMGFEPRWWFLRSPKRDKLSGHFLGAYLMTSKYDFQNDLDLCYQGEYWSAGLTYGFSLPLGKVMNLEFTASVGYLNSDYRHYQPDTEYEHLYRDKYKVGVFQYFGPTKLKVSLVLPITIWRRV